MKRLILTLVLALLAVSNAVFANPVDENLAREIGAKFLQASTTMKVANSNDLELVKTYNVERGAAAFYVFNTTSGFVIVAADECSTPIIGYSDNGKFDENDIPVQLQEYLQDFVDQIQFGMDNGSEANEETIRQWELVKTIGRLKEQRDTKAVEPLLTETWNQGCYYNALCPVDASSPACQRVYAGCVATAMGQIMHYWRFPETGVGSHTYTYSPYPTQTANFGETTYDWANMPDFINANSSPEEINAVATLLWHCGISVNMMYGPDGSGAYSFDVPSAMINYFRYSNEMSLSYKSSYSTAEWISKLKASIDINRPLYYSGSSSSGGHAFVCDGYDSNDLFHFNFGWSGSSNGYYAMGDVLGYNSYNAAIFNIHPTQYTITLSVDDVNGGTVTGGGSYDDGATVSITATPNAGYSFHGWIENGGIVSTNENYSFTASCNRNLMAAFGDQFTVTTTVNANVGGSVSGGGEFYSGTTCTITATPDEGYYFSKWTLNGETVSVYRTYTFTATEAAEYVAHFLAVEENMSYSSYDWQTNAAARTWTHVWDDGKVSFAFTQANESNFSDRGTGIITYDANTDTWKFSGGRVETEKTGWGSIAQYGSNSLVIVAHTANDCRVYIADDKDNITANSLTAVSILDNTYEPTWPNVMTSGVNRDIIHIAVTANEYTIDGVTDPIIYFRSQDGGHTWDKENVILPFMTSDYSTYSHSNYCYWMETTDDNCLALVVNNPWSDGMVIYSYDDGETWERKVFFQHPNPTATFDTMLIYPRWTSCQWDSHNNLHVLYEWNGTQGSVGSGTYYPYEGGVAYWNETLPYNVNGTTKSSIRGNLTPGQPFVMDVDYLYNDIRNSWWNNANPSHEMWPEYIGYLPPLDDAGNPEDPYNNTGFNILDYAHGGYNSGVCAFPVLCMIPGTDYMVAVWCAMDENRMENGQTYYYSLFASCSIDGGLTWSNMIHLLNDADHAYTEFVYPQAAIVDDKLIVICQMDNSTGTFLHGEELNSDPLDNYYQGFSFNIYDLFDEFVDMTPHWSPITGTQYNMNVIGIITINGEEQFNSTFEVGAFCGDECRGSVCASFFPPTGQYLVPLTIVSNVEEGEEIAFRLYDHMARVERDDLTCNVTVTFENDAVIGAVEDLFDFSFNNEHTFDLMAGWNWWSTYVEQNNIDGLTMLENSLGHNGSVIKSQTQSVINYYPQTDDDMWFGDLNAITNENGYLIQTNAACSIVHYGPEAEIANHPITLTPAWNWIGYPVDIQQNMAAATNNLTPEHNDIIKGQNTSAIYADGYGWFPDDFVLVPGQSYKYKSLADADKTFVYTRSATESVSSPHKRYWNDNSRAFAENMTVLATVYVADIEQHNSDLELGAFVNGVCRGSAKLKYFEPLNRYYAMLTISGDKEENLEFALVNAEQNMMGNSSEESLTFAADAVIGSFDEPFEIHFGEMTDIDRSSLVIYPNPVDRNETFTFDIPKDETIKEIIITDALGSVVCKNTFSLRVSGVYMVKAVCASGNVYFGKLIVK